MNRLCTIIAITSLLTTTGESFAQQTSSPRGAVVVTANQDGRIDSFQQIFDITTKNYAPMSKECELFGERVVGTAYVIKKSDKRLELMFRHIQADGIAYAEHDIIVVYQPEVERMRALIRRAVQTPGTNEAEFARYASSPIVPTSIDSIVTDRLIHEYGHLFFRKKEAALGVIAKSDMEEEYFVRATELIYSNNPNYSFLDNILQYMQETPYAEYLINNAGRTLNRDLTFHKNFPTEKEIRKIGWALILNHPTYRKMIPEKTIKNVTSSLSR